MQRYSILKELGTGAYGTVYQAMDTQTRQIVAIKQIHQKTAWDDAKNLVELKSFKKIRTHPNLVNLFELFREKDGTLYFVFELINSGSLYDYILKCQRLNKPPTIQEVTKISYQLLLGLGHIHSNGFIHRDLKLENVLMHADDSPTAIALSQSPQPLVPKIADLGCAKETRARITLNTLYTGTRWYRSVELLMRDQSYAKPNDVWAVGCILVELFTLRPLFSGQSELDMLHLIMQQLGPLYEGEWPEYQQLAQKMNFVSTTPISKTKYQTGASHQRIVERLQQVMKHASGDCVDCIAWMLELNPERRWTVDQLLNHKWFREEAARIGSNPSVPNSTPKERSASHPYSTEGGDNAVLNKAKNLLKQQSGVSSSAVNDFNYDMVEMMLETKPAPSHSSSNAPSQKKVIKSTKDMLHDNDGLDAKLDMLDDW